LGGKAWLTGYHDDVGEGVYVSAKVTGVAHHPAHTVCSLSSWIFREPVDPVALGVPTYFDIIPRRDARDLRTIRQKLDADKYDTVEAFEADLELMLGNAIKFNGLESEVGNITVTMQNRVHELFDTWRSGSNKKRKDGDKGTPQPTKKVKLG
jgi:transcription initiation factor TFIID subunit 2